MQAKSEKNCININGQLIPWSFVGRIHKKCGGDWDMTIDVFWKARNAKGTNGIQRYIMSGFKPNQYGQKHAFAPSREREDGKMESLRQWWGGLYLRRRATSAVSKEELFTLIVFCKNHPST